jgi:hypothetical protein
VLPRTFSLAILRRLVVALELCAAPFAQLATGVLEVRILLAINVDTIVSTGVAAIHTQI